MWTISKVSPRPAVREPAENNRGGLLEGWCEAVVFQSASPACSRLLLPAQWARLCQAPAVGAAIGC